MHRCHGVFLTMTVLFNIVRGVGAASYYGILSLFMAISLNCCDTIVQQYQCIPQQNIARPQAARFVTTFLQCPYPIMVSRLKLTHFDI